MLVLSIGDEEFFDESTSKFVKKPGIIVEFEHSLVSLSKWESKHEKPFLSGDEKTDDEILDYIRCMIISPGDSAEILSRMNQKDVDAVTTYIDSKQTATTFGNLPERKGRGETITNELIYYWLVAFEIEWEAQYWHLNRLFSLIKICNIKNSKPKPMSKSEIAARQRELNAQRRRETGSRG